MRCMRSVKTRPKRRAAASAWAARLKADSRDFDSAWKLARQYYWLGTHGPASGRRADLEAGIAAARAAIALQAARPEGHFWLAANMGALAESFGMRQGIKYRRPVRDALEETLRIDPTFLGGARRSGARPLVLQGPRPLRRQQPEVGRAPPQGPHLRSRQHDHLVLSRRNAVRPQPPRRGARRPPEGDRRPDQGGMGAGRSRMEGQGAGAAREGQEAVTNY